MKRSIVASAAVAATAATGAVLYNVISNKKAADDFDIESFKWDDPESLTQLDQEIYRLSLEHVEEAAALLRELVRIPADYCDEDPMNGTSNHEGQRLEYLKKWIADNGAVLKPEDVDFDEFGSLVWTVTDPDDPMPLEERKVIYFDGHSDTVYPLRKDWQDRIGKGIDCYNGLTDPEQVSEAALVKELRYVPPKDKWDSLIFGRGSADQLQGVVTQAIVTKILLKTRHLGSLRGSIIRSIATVTEEDNDGGAPMHILRKQKLTRDQIPDCVILTEGTGDLTLGPCGIYIGQRGRCQVEVEVIGQSCHGSMPTQGLNPLEYGSLIIAEAAEQAKNGFLPNKFLGPGTRTASWCEIKTPSDCAVPAKFTFRFDRRMTKNEDSAMAIQEIESLKAVTTARNAGCTVNVRIPQYTQPSHKGTMADNLQDYMGWVTTPTDPVVLAAVEAYKRTVTPHVEEPPNPGPDDLRKQPRVQRWIFSTDGVGYPLPKDKLPFDITGKNWLENGNHVHPPMFGVTAGYEHHCHKLGEYVHKDHLWLGVAVMARFPSLFVEKRKQADEAQQ